MERQCQAGFSPSTFLAPSQHCQLWAGMLRVQQAEPQLQSWTASKSSLGSHEKSGSQQEQSPAKPPNTTPNTMLQHSMALTSSPLR